MICRCLSSGFAGNSRVMRISMTKEEGGVTGEPWTPIRNKALAYAQCERSWLVSLAPTSMLRSALIPACSPH